MLRKIFGYSDDQSTAIASVVDLPNLSDFIVNYVWINEDVFSIPSDDDHRAPLCGIPLHYIDQTINNAMRYPDTIFQIWIDPRFLTDTPSIFLLESHLYMRGQIDNIRIRDLNDIDAYKHDPDNFFSPEQGNSIWARVDLARLLVLRHVLDERDSGNKIALYADFDIHDVFQETYALRHAIANHGFAVGSVTVIDSEEYLSIENGFMAFAYHNLIDHVWNICSSEKDKIPHDDRDTVYGAFLLAFDDLLRIKDILRTDVIVPEIQKPNFYQIKKPDYLENICV